MTAPLSYRPASGRDATAIADLHAESWRRTYRGVLRDEFLDGPVREDRRATWVGRLSSGREDQRVIVAVAGGTMVGFICAYVQDEVGWGVFIDNLHVAADWQAGGLGTGLLNAVASWATAARPDGRPYLWVAERNEAAQRFYARRGARSYELVVRDAPGGGSASFVRYAWDDVADLFRQTAAASNRSLR